MYRQRCSGRPAIKEMVLQTSTHSDDPNIPYSSPPQLQRTMDRRGLHPGVRKTMFTWLAIKMNGLIKLGEEGGEGGGGWLPLVNWKEGMM